MGSSEGRTSPWDGLDTDSERLVDGASRATNQPTEIEALKAENEKLEEMVDHLRLGLRSASKAITSLLSNDNEKTRQAMRGIATHLASVDPCSICEGPLRGESLEAYGAHILERTMDEIHALETLDSIVQIARRDAAERLAKAAEDEEGSGL